MLNYLKRCWARPYYGYAVCFEFQCQQLIHLFCYFVRAAFFCGQIEERRTSHMSSWFTAGDLEIQVAVSSVGVYLVEQHEGVCHI